MDKTPDCSLCNGDIGLVAVDVDVEVDVDVDVDVDGFLILIGTKFDMNNLI